MAVQCDAVLTALDSVDETEYFSVFQFIWMTLQTSHNFLGIRLKKVTK
jgi:hypothetical protein